MDVTKALGLPSLLTGKTHTDVVFFLRVSLRLSGLPMSIGLKDPTDTLRASSKFIDGHAGSCSPVVRPIEVADFYVDVLEVCSGKNK